jgi:hypothetical protein
MIIPIGNWYIANEAIVSKADYIIVQNENIELQNTIETYALQTSTETATDDEYTDETLTITDVYKVAKQYSDTIYMNDSGYKCPTLDAIQQFLAKDTVSEQPYVADEFDCENYAIDTLSHVLDYFGNIPFGSVRIHNTEDGGGHRLNCAYIEGTWYWIEPQSDQLYTEMDDKYEVRFIMI